MCPSLKGTSWGSGGCPSQAPFPLAGAQPPRPSPGRSRTPATARPGTPAHPWRVVSLHVKPTTGPGRTKAREWTRHAARHRVPGGRTVSRAHLTWRPQVGRSRRSRAARQGGRAPRGPASCHGAGAWARRRARSRHRLRGRESVAVSGSSKGERRSSPQPRGPALPCGTAPQPFLRARLRGAGEARSGLSLSEALELLCAQPSRALPEGRLCPALALPGFESAPTNQGVPPSIPPLRTRSL